MAAGYLLSANNLPSDKHYSELCPRGRRHCAGFLHRQLAAAPPNRRQILVRLPTTPVEPWTSHDTGHLSLALPYGCVARW